MRRTIVLSLTVAMFALIGSQAMAASFHSARSCTYCHVPHNAIGDGGDNINEQVPLWNPEHSTTTLTGNYVNTDNSMQATVGAPNGASKTCLSCHDGTYGYVAYVGTHVFGDGAAMGSLANTHPVSFVYDAGLAAADGELVDPATLADDVLDGLNQMQCTSCHDIHSSAYPNPLGAEAEVDGDGNVIVDENGDPVYPNGPYLRWEYDHGNAPSEGDFCRNCHIK